VSWGLDRAALEAGRAEAAQRAEEHPSSHTYEQLARAHRWLDEPTAAAKLFAEAVQRDERAFKGGYGSVWGRRGGLLHLAGDERGARKWLKRALKDDPGPYDEAAWRYLTGDHAGALAAAAREPEPNAYLRGLVALTRARSQRDPALARHARERFAEAIRGVRMPPYMESGSSDMSLFDWLEESFRLEADLAGTGLPDHLGMLEQAGLLNATAKPRRRTAPDLPPPPGRYPVSRETPDGATVESVLVMTPERDAELILDPRPAVNIRLALIVEYGEFRVRVTAGAEDEGPYEEDLPDRYAGFRAACEAGADWLRAGVSNDGAWAADTVAALIDDALR
jgi:tetratricopeptide (TPR) repeat protein